MKLPRSLSASALLVNESRARRVDISQDRFARLWVTDETRALWDEFAAEVYPFDAIELGLRNRFFLEALRSFVRSVEHPVCINIAAGFTSYPFLIEEPCRWVEADLEQVVSLKEQQVNQWMAQGLLPARTLEFIAVDLQVGLSRRLLFRRLQELVGDAPSFILLEGITYYLKLRSLHALLSGCGAIQQPGSLLACDFWDASLAENPTFRRLTSFFSSRFGFDASRYLFLDPARFHQLAEYEVVEETDVQSLEKRFLHSEILQDSSAVIPEHYVVLRRRP